MQLDAKDFHKRFEAGTLKLAFIGMSNIGKSYTASRLATHYGFERIEVDNLIWESLGYESMAELAAWQGQPYEKGYDEREAKSIQLESQALNKAMDLALTKDAGNVIIDTPGSVIYTDETALERLKSNFVIVHIKAAVNDIERLTQDYFDNPKPLVWAGHYKPAGKLSEQENILACYPALLAARAKKYAQLSDVTLRSDFIINPKVSPEEIYKAISVS